MEIFPTPGLPSSSHRALDVTAARDVLDRLTQSDPLKRLIAAIGEKNVFLVGGVVRDVLSGKEPTDIDIAVSLSPSDVLNRLLHHKIRVLETGLQHGTVLAVIDTQHVEITSFRKQGVREIFEVGSSIEEDLSGRDFSINALAFRVSDGTFIDPFGGVDDLKNNILVAVSKAFQRILEDPLRMLRMIRFGPAAGRIVDPALIDATIAHSQLLASVSVERIKAELDKILMSAYPAEALRALKDYNLLPLTIPELIPTIGFEQNEFHVHDVFEHTLSVVSRSTLDLAVRWSALFHDIGKAHTLSVDEKGRRHFYKHENVSETIAVHRLKSLRASAEETRRIALLVRHHMRPLNCGPSGRRRIMRDLGSELDLWLHLKQADASPLVPHQEVKLDLENFKAAVEDELKRQNGPVYGKLAVDGTDLLALGLSPGPKVGKILGMLKEMVLDEPDQNQFDILIEHAKSMLREKAV